MELNMRTIKELLNKLFSKEDRSNGYKWVPDNEGLNFHVKPSITAKISKNEADSGLTLQHIALNMLVEQGRAEIIPNGFIVPTDVAVNLDKATQHLLDLPPQWTGSIKADIKGVTGRADFSVSLKVKTEDGGYSGSYALKGPILELSPTQRHILTPAQQVIFSSIEKHRASNKSEYDNLQAILALQNAQKSGANISLAHFEKLNIKAPESISVNAEFDDDENLILTPFMGQDASHERVQKVFGQLRQDRSTALRVDDEIILFDEKKLTAIHEILKNRIVPKTKFKQFLQNPTAFIDASLVGLDIGFSMRVHGATKFKHAYFGETDESGIDWFGSNANVESVLPISKLPIYAGDQDKLKQFKAQFTDAVKAGADELTFAGNIFDISDREAVSQTIKKIEGTIYDGNSSSDDVAEGDNASVPENENDPEVAVVDIDLNDEQIDVASPALEKSLNQILYPPENLDWSNYSRKPYPHQDIGVRWILGLALTENKFSGGLLADDMGLGKTYMALSAIDHIYKIYDESNKTKKPCLVVAPLSLIQNWKDEVEMTFSTSPFKDIVILQSEADLPRFRVGGVETQQQVVDENSTAEIRYSLKVGKSFLQERLDLPQRLVITTYQTLRDYQFSLCTIDWGVVIYDESQNIKNPNTLQTRAAKGLKAEFKLLATGTPVENSLADFWCLLDTACQGYLDSYQNFRQTYVVPIFQAAGDEIEEVRGRIGRELRLKVGPLMLRRVKEDNLKGLPEKDIFVGIKGEDWEYMPSLDTLMEGPQLEAYNATISAQDESESNMLGTLRRLGNVSLHPQLADGGQLVVPKNSRKLESLISESGKMRSLLLTLDDIKQRREKCIVFVINKRLQAFLSFVLGKRYNLGTLSVVNGDTKAIAKRASVPTRKSIISDFEDSEGFNIIIMSPIAAGVGLTIVGANNVIHLERHWNPAKEAQATDRVHRIGQKRNVKVYIPISHHPKYESLDVNLHRLLSNKTQLRDAVVTPEQVVPKPEGFGDGATEPNHIIIADDLQRLSWQQFEALCAELFLKENTASSCWLTQTGSDYGADVVLVTGDSGILIQCKHTKGGRYDGYKAIQEIHSAHTKYSQELEKNIAILIFATNAKILSAKTKKLAGQYDVQIFSYNEIVALLENHSITFQMVLTRLGKKRLKVG